ncbi:MAG TPA: hypothetical protein VKA32_00195 [Gammaproteobacteria bacterium]|nr:hypothetical protein [Gammaproteobacteria bacterium]
MKRTLLVLLLLVSFAAAAAGGWYATHAGKGDTDPASLLAMVPADTVFYSGYSKPFDPQPYLDAWHVAFPLGDKMNDAFDPKRATDEGGAALGVLAALERMNLKQMSEGKRTATYFGASKETVFAAYAVGALPVLRYRLADQETFWKRVDAAEKEAGVSVKPTDDGDATVRRYPFKAHTDDGNLQLVLATRDGYAIATLDGPGIDADHLEMALGNSLPKRSLADSDRLQTIAKRVGTEPWATGFIDHEAVVAGLTGDEGSDFGRMLDNITTAWGADKDLFASLREPACRDDARAIAALWPRTVFGITHLDEDKAEIDSRIAVESTDSDLMAEIMRLRGHIPTVSETRPPLGLGLGLNLSEVVPVMQSLLARFSKATFKCPPLVQAQQQAMKQNVAQLGMFTAMVGDVKGVGAAFSAIKGVDDPAQISGTATVEVATDKPDTLWQLMQGMLGLPADQAPKAGGAPVEVPGALTQGRQVRAAIRDNALVFLIGDASLTGAAGEDNVDPNGLLSFDYDLGRMASTIAAASKAHNGPAEGEEVAKALNHMDLVYSGRVDASKNGFHMDIRLTPRD